MHQSTEKLIHLHAKWLAVQPLPKENRIALWQWIQMRFNFVSNKFEGNSLSYNETKALLMYGTVSGNHPFRDYVEMKAHDEAFEYMLKLAKAEKSITENGIKNLNLIALKEPFDCTVETGSVEQVRLRVTPGKYKKRQNYVETSKGKLHFFDTPEETPAKMKALVKGIQRWLEQDEKNKRQEIVPTLADLHQRFINIHPFDDGNGRVVRLLMNYILIRHDFLPMVLEDRNQYIQALQIADAGDSSQIKNLFADNIATMLEKGIAAKTELIKIDDTEVSGDLGKTSLGIE